MVRKLELFLSFKIGSYKNRTIYEGQAPKEKRKECGVNG
jgi:hypothetical protein